MRFFANDHSRDTVVIDPQPMPLIDARGAGTTLDGEGFELVEHRSAVADFTDAADVAAVHPAEIAALVQRLTGADHVSVTGVGVLRFAERSALSGKLDNSLPARFAHVDVSDATAAQFSARSAPEGRGIRRSAHYNVWRAISPPPQDVPLALCDARSIAARDLQPADAIFDRPGQPDWTFEAWLVAHDPAHRWHWFSALDRDQAVVFKTWDSDAAAAHCVPHVAFDDPDCPADAQPRASIEMRAIAYWFD
jgi:hypothetical protein